MSYLRVIERLENMLHEALEIIDEQSKILAQHGIETEDGKLEASGSPTIRFLPENFMITPPLRSGSINESCFSAVDPVRG